MNASKEILAALAFLAAVGTAQGASLSGSVETASGDPLAATVTILRVSGGVELDTRDTAEDGTFSIELAGSGFIAVATGAPGYAFEEIDLTNGIPTSSVRFRLHPLRTLP